MAKLKFFLVFLVIVKVSLVLIAFSDGLSLPSRAIAQEAATDDPTPAVKEKEGASATAEVTEPIDEHAGYLRMERKKIEEEKKSLMLLRAEVRKEIMSMETARKELDQRLAKMDVEKQNRITKLVKIYQKMSAKDVVPLLENLDEDLMLNVLYRLKEKNQSQILSLMDPEKAAKISKMLLSADLN